MQAESQLFMSQPVPNWSTCEHHILSSAFSEFRKRLFTSLCMSVCLFLCMSLRPSTWYN